MRRLSAFLLLLVVTGCGSDSTPVSSESSVVPLSINNPAQMESGEQAVAGNAARSKVVEQLIGVARQSVVQGQPARAIEALSQAIGISPSESRLLRLRADVYALTGELANARADFSSAVRCDPNNAELYNVRGYFLMTHGVHAEALADFDKALELNPNAAETWNNRGLIYLSRQEYDRAEKQFAKAVECNREYADAWNNLGFARMKQDRLDLALSDIHESIQRNPKFVAAWNNMGLIHMKQGHYPEAEKAFAKTIEIAPMDGRWYAHHRAALLKLERFDEAAADERRANWLNGLTQLTQHAKANVQDPNRWFARANWLADGKEYGAAIQDYSRVLQLQPGSTQALNARAAAWVHTGELQKAIDDCDNSLVIARTTEAFSIRGDAWLAMNNLDQAISDYEAAQRFDEDVADAYRRRAEKLRKDGDEAKAKEDIAKAHEIEEALAGRTAQSSEVHNGPSPFPEE